MANGSIHDMPLPDWFIREVLREEREVKEKVERCIHARFVASVSVGRLSDVVDGPITGYTANVTVKCEQCNLPFRFLGSEFGSHPREPRLSADSCELRAPIEPAHVTEILGMPVRSGTA